MGSIIKSLLVMKMEIFHLLVLRIPIMVLQDSQQKKQ